MMRISKRVGVIVLGAVFVGGVFVGQVFDPGQAVSAKASDVVYELRTYTANDGKLEGMVKELGFASKVFERHGIENVGYWVPTDSPLSENTLIYILKFDSREAQAEQWQNFRDDPEWRKAFEEFNKDGRLVAGVESVFMQPTSYSPMQ